MVEIKIEYFVSCFLNSKRLEVGSTFYLKKDEKQNYIVVSTLEEKVGEADEEQSNVNIKSNLKSKNYFPSPEVHLEFFFGVIVFVRVKESKK